MSDSNALMKYGLLGGLGLMAAVEAPRRFPAVKNLPRDVQFLAMALKAMRLSKQIDKNNYTVGKLFTDAVKKHPKKLMLVEADTGEEWTFQDVDEKSNQLAHLLLSRGLTRGDVVAVVMTNRAFYVVVMVALAKVGIPGALINYNLKGETLIHAVSIAECKACICEDVLEDDIMSVRDRLKTGNPGSLLLPMLIFGRSKHLGQPGVQSLEQELIRYPTAVLPAYVLDQVTAQDYISYVYTSGTTGLPKAAYATHLKYLIAGMLGGRSIGLGYDDRIFSSLPLYHSFAQWVPMVGSMAIGMTFIVKSKFSTSNFWEECCKHEATIIPYIGEMCRFLLATPPSPYDTKHKVRMAFGLGLKKDLWIKFQERFKVPKIVEVYGATEGATGTTNDLGVPGALGFLPSFSRALGRGLIKIDIDTMEPQRDPATGLCIECGPGEPGEFVARILDQDRGGPKNFRAYVNNPGETSKKVLKDVFKKGDVMFRSGDLMVMDERRYLFFQDRLGDTFRWRGENVSTSEVEAALRRVNGDKDTVVFGVRIPGAEGRAGMAVIYDPEGDLDVTSLSAGVQRELPFYAQPFFVRVVDGHQSMDITSTFKVIRKNLQDDGYDVTKIQDRVYYRPSTRGAWTYQQLDGETYQDLAGGKLAAAKL